MRQDLIVLGTKYYGTACYDGTGLALDKHGKGRCNLGIGRYVENQQAQPESSGRGLQMPGLERAIRFISGTDQQSNRFSGRHRLVYQLKALFSNLGERNGDAREIAARTVK